MVKDGAGGHAFCILDNSTLGSKGEMSSLQAEHDSALGILLLLQTLYIYYQDNFLLEFTVFIDSAEVLRRGNEKVPRLGIKQQLVLDYNLWATIDRL